VGDGEIVLWGFGLLAQLAGQPPIYVNRFYYEPRLPRAGLTPQEVWLPEHLGTLRAPASSKAWSNSRGAMAQALRWIVSYEECISSTAAPGYRADCLARWPRTARAVREIIPAWEQLASTCEYVAVSA
jgi:hypothetical protein